MTQQPPKEFPTAEDEAWMNAPMGTPTAEELARPASDPRSERGGVRRINAKKLGRVMRSVFKLSGRRDPFGDDEQWQTFAWLVAGAYNSDDPDGWTAVLDEVEKAAVGDVA